MCVLRNFSFESGLTSNSTLQRYFRFSRDSHPAEHLNFSQHYMTGQDRQDREISVVMPQLQIPLTCNKIGIKIINNCQIINCDWETDLEYGSVGEFNSCNIDKMLCYNFHKLMSSITKLVITVSYIRKCQFKAIK